MSDDLPFELFRRGWSIVPVNWKNKKPLVEWKPYQKERPTENQIRSWLTQFDPKAWAVITGNVSGHIFVADVDSPAADLTVPGRWAKYLFGPTLTVCSSGRIDEKPETGKRHYYGRDTKAQKLKNKAFLFAKKFNDERMPHVDIKANGGYVIAPGSKHPSGSLYEVVDGSPIADTSYDTYIHVLRLLKRHWPLVALVAGNYPKPGEGRYFGILNFAAFLYHHEFPEEDAKILVRSLAYAAIPQSEGVDTDENYETVVVSTWERAGEGTKVGYKEDSDIEWGWDNEFVQRLLALPVDVKFPEPHTPRVLEPFMAEDDDVEVETDAVEHGAEVSPETDATPPKKAAQGDGHQTKHEDKKKLKFLRTIGVIWKDEKKKDRLNHAQLGDWLAEEFHIVSIKEFKREDAVYTYDPSGVYKPFDLERHLRENILPSSWSNVRAVKETVAHVIERYRHSITEFDGEPDIINTLSGLLNRKTLQLRKHTPTHLSIVQLRVKYNKKAKMVAIQKFLEQVLVDKKQFLRMMEVGASILSPYHPAKCVFFFTGGGDNGKSVWAEVLTTFCGRTNVSALTLQRLSDGRFGAAGLLDKLANIAPDIPDKPIRDTGKVKSISGDDFVDLERKFGKIWSQMVRAELIFCCNRLPMAQDDTDAWFGRYEELPFPIKFVKGTKRPRRQLIKELTTDDELSGLLNEFLAVQNDLEERTEMSYSATVEEKRTRYLTNADVVFAFVDHAIEQSSSDYITATDFQARFVDFCKKQSRIPVGQKELYKRLARYMTFSKELTGAAKARVRSVKGIKFKCESCNECTECNESTLPYLVPANSRIVIIKPDSLHSVHSFHPQARIPRNPTEIKSNNNENGPCKAPDGAPSHEGFPCKRCGAK